MSDSRHGRLQFFRRVSPLTIASLLCIIVVSLVVFASELRRRQQHLMQRATETAALSKIQVPASIKAELLPQKFNAPVLRTIVPLPGSKRRFYLYISPSSSKYYSSSGLDYESVLKPWRSFFKKSQFKVVVTSKLDAVLPGRESCLILPSAVALSSKEKQDLLAFQSQGGSILATSALGLRNPNGVSEGYGLMEQLFGVTVSRELGRDEAPEGFLNLSGDTPITIGYPAAQRIWLENDHEKPQRLIGGRQAGLYSGWTRASKAGLGTAAVVYGEHGAVRRHARWVVMGFSETAWGEEENQLYGLLENSLHWLARGMLVAKATWPAPYRAAHILEMDTEEGFKNAARLAQMMDNVEMPATFYCLTSEALRHRAMVRELAKRHEIAFHGDVHNGFWGLTEREQTARLGRMQDDIKDILGQRLQRPGFRAPLEKYDKTTERILYLQGFGHHAADPNRTDASLPFFYQADSPAEADRMVILPRTQRDDFNLPLGREGREAEKTLRDAMVADFDIVLQMGAMGFLSIHSQHFGPGSLLAGVMPEFLQHAARHRDQVWMASSDQVARWWHERERLDYSIRGRSDRLTLMVTIKGQQPLDHGALILTNSQADVPVQIRPLGPTFAKAVVRPVDALRSAIVFDGAAPGRYSFEVVSATERPDKSGASAEKKRFVQ